MAETLRNAINKANPNDLDARLHQLYDETNDLGFADILSAARPRNRSRTGLTSSATQAHDVASTLYSVESPQGTPLDIVTSAPGAGQVQITYDGTTGVPTLVFNAAVTEYHTTEGGPLPQNLAGQMALEL